MNKKKEIKPNLLYMRLWDKRCSPDFEKKQKTLILAVEGDEIVGM